MTNREFFFGQHGVRLNPDLVKNMPNGKTKPVNYNAFTVEDTLIAFEGRVIILNCSRVTLSLGGYIEMSHNIYYVKK